MIRGTLLDHYMTHDSEEVSLFSHTLTWWILAYSVPPSTNMMSPSETLPPSWSLLQRVPESFRRLCNYETNLSQTATRSSTTFYLRLSRKIRSRPVVELFFVDPNNTRRLFRTYPNSLICLNVVIIKSCLITLKNSVNSLKKGVFYHYIENEMIV